MNITALKNLISTARQHYFNGGAPPDDSVYDQWVAELRKHAPNDVLLTEVGAPVSADATQDKVCHIHPMGSLNNAMNAEEFMVFHKRINFEVNGGDIGEEPRHNVSFKMDGASAALIYRDGVLVQGITRGDGETGEDITANVLRMTGVPRFVSTILGYPFTGSVRGEMMLFNKEWKELDPDQLSNPRNLGNGISRRSDGEDCEKLTFVAFRLFTADGFPMDQLTTPPDPGPGTESGMLGTMSRMGFQVVSHWARFTAEQVLRLYDFAQGEKPTGEDVFRGFGQELNRDKLPFEIDGLVIKAESLALQTQMGESGNCPKSMVALKFPPRGGQTQVLSVELTVGHTGGIIPTAVLAPIKIGGVTVSRALLCNWDEITRLDVAIGDTVEVVRRGDVIPKIVSVVSRPKTRSLIEKPTQCPVTGGPVGHRKNVDGTDSVVLFSLSQDNPAVVKGKIKRWVKSLDIQGLGEVFIDQLVNDGVLKTPADIYNIAGPARTGVELVLGAARTRTLLAEIDKKRNLTLAEFLGSLGMDGLGKRRVVLVQAKDPGQFDRLDDWLYGKLVDRAAQAGLPKIAAGIQQQIDNNAELIHDLLKSGVSIMHTAPPAPAPKAEGTLTFCLTGKFGEPKAFYHGQITAAGHQFEPDYRKGLSYLVTADPGALSSKTRKAIKDGVPVIDEVKLLALLQ